MKRPIQTEIATEGQDSFLDVVTNIVGILIILVMVVGARVRHVVMSAKSATSTSDAALAEEVTSLGRRPSRPHTTSRESSGRRSASSRPP